MKILECVAHACSILMKKCSHAVIFIPTVDNPIKMSHSLSHQENTSPESVYVWMISLTNMKSDHKQLSSRCAWLILLSCGLVYDQQKKAVLPLLKEKTG